jgi:hypothetical protein
VPNTPTGAPFTGQSTDVITDTAPGTPYALTGSPQADSVTVEPAGVSGTDYTLSGNTFTILSGGALSDTDALTLTYAFVTTDQVLCCEPLLNGTPVTTPTLRGVYTVWLPFVDE